MFDLYPCVRRAAAVAHLTAHRTDQFSLQSLIKMDLKKLNDKHGDDNLAFSDNFRSAEAVVQDWASVRDRVQTHTSRPTAALSCIDLHAHTHAYT